MRDHHEILHEAIKATTGDIWECGVYRGDSAIIMRRFAEPSRNLHLFDTFSGMPISGPYDTHQIGSFSGTSVDLVRGRFLDYQNVYMHIGMMPQTFSGLEHCTISVANVDVDQYESVKTCAEFIYPRMDSGGYMIFDDYYCKDCPGAKKAVDEFMVGKPERLVTDQGGQPYLIKA